MGDVSWRELGAWQADRQRFSRNPSSNSTVFAMELHGCRAGGRAVLFGVQEAAEGEDEQDGGDAGRKDSGQYG